jgi:hypothetical protein
LIIIREVIFTKNTIIFSLFHLLFPDNKKGEAAGTHPKNEAELPTLASTRLGDYIFIAWGKRKTPNVDFVFFHLSVTHND